MVRFALLGISIGSLARGRATAFNPEALKKKVRATLSRRRKAGGFSQRVDTLRGRDL